MVAVLYAVLVFKTRAENESPDVAGIARSRPVVAADRTASSDISASLRTLTPADASWLVSGPIGVSDFCGSRPPDGFGAAWSPTNCSRTVYAYFFSDDSPEQQMKAWDAALRASGWTAVGASMSKQIPASYVRVPQGSSTIGQRIGLAVQWVPRSEVARLFEPAGAMATDVAWIQQTAVPLDVLESAAFSRYRFVALASLTVEYYGPDAEPTSTPTTTSKGWSGQCVSGSDTCD